MRSNWRGSSKKIGVLVFLRTKSTQLVFGNAKVDRSLPVEIHSQVLGGTLAFGELPRERKERGTRDVPGFRLSSITRLDVSLPYYSSSFRKFASPPGLSRPGNSHLDAMVMRPLLGSTLTFARAFPRLSPRIDPGPFVSSCPLRFVPNYLLEEYYVDSSSFFFTITRRVFLRSILFQRIVLGKQSRGISLVKCTYARE